MKKNAQSVLDAANKKSQQYRQEVEVEKIKKNVTINANDSIEGLVDSIVDSYKSAKKYAKEHEIGKHTKQYTNLLVDVASVFLKNFAKKAIDPEAKDIKK